MSATVIVHGMIRGVRTGTSKAGNGYRIVSVLTEMGDSLGETLGILIMDPTEARPDAPSPATDALRADVSWVVDVSGRAGNTTDASAMFVREVEETDLHIVAASLAAVQTGAKS